MDKKTFYRLCNNLGPVAFACYMICVIIGLVIRRLKGNYIPWLLLAAFAIGVTVLWGAAFIKLQQTKWYKEMEKQSRNGRLYQIKRKNRIKIYRLRSRDNVIEYINNQLAEYAKEDFEGQVLYYKRYTSDDPIYRDNSYTAAFLLLDDATADLWRQQRQEKVFKQLDEKLTALWDSKGLNTDFIVCAVICLHDEMEEEDKDFYYKSGGYVDSAVNEKVLTLDKSYAFCGIDRKTCRVYFSLPEVCKGESADLRGFIIKELGVLPLKSFEEKYGLK